MSRANDAIAPERALVVPRARRPSGQACLPIEELLLPILRSHTPGAIYLYAPPGGGKTTALSHLRAVLPPDVKVGLLDDPQFDRWTPDGPSKSVVATSHLPSGPNLATFHLAFWGEDEWLEYLVANHREKCASVLKRLRADPCVPTLDGCPELLRIVMDRMAADESLTNTSDALRRHWWDLVPPGDDRHAAMALCLRHLNRNPATIEELEPHVRPPIVRFLRHAAAQRVVGAEAVAQILCDGHLPKLRELRLPQNPRSLREIVAAVRLRPSAVQRLEQLIDAKHGTFADALAASVLVALDPRWLPKSGRGLLLDHAMLSGAAWMKLDLTEARLEYADLRKADLLLADLSQVNARDVCLADANLVSATLNGARMAGANLRGADLSHARAGRAHFELADFEGANLFRADLKEVVIIGGSLKQAKLIGADLSRANLRACDVKNADLSNARLEQATLWHVTMRGATWTGASFAGARLDQCILAGVEMPDVDFSGADLSGSILTASNMPHANFSDANLTNCGLAEIDWPGADLRDADFTNASFHMGSSRSGLVGSVIPCEGSKTGFYTDEFTEQEFKCPEEIRKANLSGADLRGAKVEGNDWYLVDLRGAKYTPDQAKHLARCGAILKSRVT